MSASSCVWAVGKGGRGSLGGESGELGQHSRIQRVGLGEPGGHLAEGAGAIGMHPAQRQAELLRHAHQRALIAAGRFADHVGARRPGALERGGDRRLLIGDAQGAPARVRDVDPLFRHIDSDKKRLGNEALVRRRGCTTTGN